MTSKLQEHVPAQLTLSASTAAEMMMPNPVSIRDVATIPEALALLTKKGFGAAPVIDEAGHPAGVLSCSDLLVHQREQVERVDPAVVRDVMTPGVFSVAPATPARRVVSQLLALNIHRLFVVDDAGVLVGVISAVDVLRHLR